MEQIKSIANIAPSVHQYETLAEEYFDVYNHQTFAKNFYMFPTVPSLEDINNLKLMAKESPLVDGGCLTTHFWTYKDYRFTSLAEYLLRRFAKVSMICTLPFLILGFILHFPMHAPHCLTVSTWISILNFLKVHSMTGFRLYFLTIILLLMAFALYPLPFAAMIFVPIGLVQRKKHKHLIAELEKVETKIAPVLKLLPPSYRNQDYTNLINRLLQTNNCLNMANILHECNMLWIDEARSGGGFFGNCAPLKICYNLPYKKNDTGKHDELVQPKCDISKINAIRNSALESPMCPQDIKTHEAPGSSTPEKDLESLIGLASLKEQVRRLKYRIDFDTESGGKSCCKHNMCFLGAAGTGKTTVAKIITGFLYNYGYIMQNRLVSVEGSYFKANWAGQTTERASDIIKYATGGVLFIDEAYTLGTETGQKAGDHYSSEALGVLLKAMEDSESHTVIILAGYKDKMNDLFAMNEGLRSRIQHTLIFDSYSADELVQIYIKMLYEHSGSTNRYTITQEAREALRDAFEKEKDSENFGNARTVRTFVEESIDILAKNYAVRKKLSVNPYEVTEGVIDRLKKDRIEEATRQLPKAPNITGVITESEVRNRIRECSTSPDEELKGLIGLTNVKQEIRALKNQFAFYRSEAKRPFAGHMVFIGPSGTGKTTVASIMTSYLYQYGYIQTNSYLDITANMLLGSYPTAAAANARYILKCAQGRVLFIDEAYTLADGNMLGVQQVIGELLTAMEDPNNASVIIFAGYPNEMQKFLNLNEGLRSRITTIIRFDSYTADELTQIFIQFAAADGFSLANGCADMISQIMQVYMFEQNFGNARSARNLFTEIKKIHINRFIEKHLPETERYLLTRADIEQWIGNQKLLSYPVLDEAKRIS